MLNSYQLYRVTLACLVVSKAFYKPTNTPKAYLLYGLFGIHTAYRTKYFDPSLTILIEKSWKNNSK